MQNKEKNQKIINFTIKTSEKETKEEKIEKIKDIDIFIKENGITVVDDIETLREIESLSEDDIVEGLNYGL